MLHNNKELFEQAVLKTAEYLKIDAGIIEKDYYVTLLLKEIAMKEPDIVFKGGTSLSKCYKLIKRFSEDIDLTIEFEEKPSEGKRRKLKQNIIDSIEKYGFEIKNTDEIRSRRDFNKYIVWYPSVFRHVDLKSHVQIETMVKIRAYPNEIMEATSLIYEYLHEVDSDNIINEYGLESFKLKVQSIERTLVDKIFALADYYMSERIREHSRHIYDLYKLTESVELDHRLKTLYEQVLLERRPHKQTCFSAQEGVNMRAVITEIIDSEVYRKDYESITNSLIFDDVKYDEAITALEKIKGFL